MKPLPWLVAAILAAAVFVYTVRLHFRPPCQTCGVKPRNPPYRGWHTSRPS